jgi:hypothetical protein
LSRPDPSEPSGRIIRLNPGRLSEGIALEQLSFGLMHVRDQIDRETAGAVSPLRQLAAVDALMQQSHDHIAALFTAAREKHDAVLSADDAMRVAIAQVEHATMAYYWLRIGQPLDRLPAIGGGSRPPVSATKSREARESVLSVIQRTCRTASDILDDLWEVRPPSKTIELVFARLRSQMLCVRILAFLVVRVYTRRKPVPKNELRTMLRELDAVRLAPNFPERSESDRALVWQTASALYDVLGERDKLATALKERRALTSNRPQARASLIVDILAVAKDDAQTVAVLSELEDLGRSTPLGPLFSRERVGRVSVLRDAPWATAVSVPPESDYAAFALETAFACYGTWMYGYRLEPREGVIQIASDWSGRGRIGWQTGGATHVQPISVDLRVIDRFLSATALTQTKDRSPIERMTQFVDREVAPVLTEAIADREDLRLQVGGPLSGVPLLMTAINGTALGESPSVAYMHPNPMVQGSDPRAGPFELLVIDESFGDQSARVRSAAEYAAERSSRALRVLAFNSDAKEAVLSDEELGQALQSSSSAMVFCHVDTRVAQAPASAIVTGFSSRLRVDTLAALDLRDLDELAIIGCGSGRADPFVGDVTVAHAAAMAGARQILYSLWPITVSLGAELATELIAAHLAGMSTPECLAGEFRDDRNKASAFALIRP